MDMNCMKIICQRIVNNCNWRQAMEMNMQFNQMMQFGCNGMIFLFAKVYKTDLGQG